MTTKQYQSPRSRKKRPAPKSMAAMFAAAKRQAKAKRPKPPTLAARLEALESDNAQLRARLASVERDQTAEFSTNVRLERIEKEQATAAWFRQEILFGVAARLMTNQPALPK